MPIRKIVQFSVNAVCCWLLTTVSCLAQPYFQKTFGEAGIDIGREVQQTSDGGYIIAGETSNFGAGGSDVYLIKTDASGDTLWIRTYGGTGNEYGNSVQQTSDGGYIIAGNTNSFGAGVNDVYLLRVNANGSIAWSRTYGGANNDIGYAVRQTSDGGYIVTGKTGSSGAGLDDVYLVKTNSTGDTTWTKTYGGSNFDVGQSVRQTTDFGYIITGSTTSFGAGGNDVYLVKTNSGGDTLWTRAFGGTGADAGWSVKQTSDGGYIISGETNTFGTPGSNVNIYLLKVASNGILQWSKTLEGPGNPGPPDPGNDYGYSVWQNTSGGYAITGSTNSNGASTIETYLCITNSTGVPVDFARTFGGPNGNDYLYSVQQTTDGGYVMAGSTENFGAGSSDVFLVKTDSIGDNSNSCGTGGFSFISSVAATVQSSTATIVGSGGTVTNPATIVSGTATLGTKLPLGVLVIVTNVSCYGGSDGQAIATPMAGTAPYTYNWIPGDNDSIEDSLSAGTYTLQVLDTWGCMQQETVIITEPDSIALTTTIDSTVICGSGDSTGVATVHLTGGTSPYNYTWSTGSSTFGVPDTFNTENGLPEGTYTVVVSDANGCVQSDTVTFGLVLTTGTTDAFSCWSNDGSAWVNVSNGTTPYTYQWDDTLFQTTSTATGLSTGPFKVVVTDADGCRDSAIVVINTVSAGAPEIQIDSVINISCKGANDGAIYLTGTGNGIRPYIFTWSPNVSPDSIATGLFAGTYVITVTDAVGCNDGVSITLTEPPLALIANITDSSGVTCFGDDDGFATVTVSGSGPFTYLWSPSGGTSTTATGLSSGPNSVTVTDVDGCIATDNVNITGPLSALTITIDTNSASCGGSDGMAWVVVSGGTNPYAFLWSPTAQTNDTAFNLPAGTYKVLVTDANGCQDSATATIVESGAPVITIDSIINVSCNGGSDGAIYISVSLGTPGYNYFWTPGGMITQDITGLTAQTYNVTVTDANFCNVIGSANVTQPPAINISSAVSTNITCNGANNGTITVTASGGTGALSYSIDGGFTFLNTTGIFAGLGPGTYDIAVRDANGCIQIGPTLLITEPTAISIISQTSTAITCNGFNDGTITISATGGTGLLSDSITNRPYQPDSTPFTGLVPGSYAITVRDANGCTQTGGPIIINQPAAITITSIDTTDVTVCGASDGTITINATGGTGALQDSITGRPYQPDGTPFTGLAVGSYAITVKDANGCTLIGSTITINDPGTISIISQSSTVITCNGFNNGTITITASGGSGNLSYSINGGVTYQGSGSFINLPPGTYNIMVRDTINCQEPGNPITIIDPPAININSAVSTDITCDGDGNGTIIVSASGGTGTLQDSINGFAYQPDSTYFTGLNAGTYTITVKDANGCTQDTTLTIINPPAINIDSVVSTDVTTCGGSDGTITITASGGTAPLEYSIDGGANYQSSGNFSNLSQGTDSVIVRDANGCTKTGGAITVNDPSAVVVTSVVNSNVTCNGGSDGSATLTASGGTPPYSYLWTPSGGTGSVATGLIADTYTATVTDTNGCSASSIITITQPEAITATITVIDPTLGKCDGSATLTASGGTPPYTYQWDTVAGSQITVTAVNLCGGTYNVTVTDASACSNTFSAQLTAPPNEFFMPTAFAPDGDDPENKKLKIRGDNIKSILLLIYDRWGEKVYETSDVVEATQKGWDGTFRNNGKLLNSDSYAYYLEVTVGTEEIIKTGDIVLIR